MRLRLATLCFITGCLLERCATLGLVPCDDKSHVKNNSQDSGEAVFYPCYQGTSYNGLVRPCAGLNTSSTGHSDEPLAVHTYVQVVDVREINEHKFYFTLALQMETSWLDPRLRVYSNGAQAARNVSLTAQAEAQLWKPQIYIYDLRLYRAVGSLNADKIHSVTLSPEGWLTVTDRYEVDVTCGFNHSYFPFDVQDCPFRYGVLDHDTSEIVFTAATLMDWTSVTDPSFMVQSSNLPFVKTISSLGQNTFHFPNGNFSYTGLHLRLERETHKYWGSYFIPMALFVVISWLSFLINVEQVPGRMGLLITLYLILVNTYSSTMAVSPPIGGFGPMGFFMMGCQATIFFAMLEYGYLLYRVKFSERKLKPSLELVTINGNPGENINQASSSLTALPVLKLRLLRLDWRCLFAFPALFAAFNAIFWSSVLWSNKGFGY